MSRRTSPLSRAIRLLGLACLLLASSMGLGACDDGGPGDEVAVDSVLVEVLVDLHLADARGQVSEDPALRDSLRDLAYSIHGTDSMHLQARLRDLATHAGAVAALTEAVESQLTLEQRGLVSP